MTSYGKLRIITRFCPLLHDSIEFNDVLRIINYRCQHVTTSSVIRLYQIMQYLPIEFQGTGKQSHFNAIWPIQPLETATLYVMQ